MPLNYTNLLVVIPTRNRADFAINAINSVLGQENCELEVIVSDNSTDAADVLKLSNYCRRLADKRLRYIRPSNPLTMTQHWDWAMRQALQISQANHIAYLTDRTLFAKNCLQNLQSILTKYPAKIVSYSFDSIDDSVFPISVSQITYSGKLFEIESASILKIYAEMERIHALPKMLNSVVPRELAATILEKYGDCFFSMSPDYNFAFRCLDLEDSILFYDRPLFISYGNHRSNGWNVLRGNFQKDALDFINNLNTTEVCFDSPIKDMWVLPNPIIHEYCYAKRQDVLHKFPEINRTKYLVSLVENVALYENEEMRAKMMEILHSHLGFNLPKYRAQALLERKFKGLKVRLHNFINAQFPYLLINKFENVEEAIKYAAESPRKPIADNKFMQERTGTNPSQKGPVLVLEDFSELTVSLTTPGLSSGDNKLKSSQFSG